MKPWEAAQAQTPPSSALPKGTLAQAAQTQEATVAAVQSGVQTTAAQTLSGTLQTAASTTPGALVTTTAVTGASTGVGVIQDIPELPAIAWLTTFAYQWVKHSKHVDQDKDAVIWLLVLSLMFGLILCWLTSHGDLWLTGGKALRACGQAAFNAATNYKMAKPLGIFSSADDLEKTS